MASPDHAQEGHCRRSTFPGCLNAGTAPCGSITLRRTSTTTAMAIAWLVSAWSTTMPIPPGGSSTSYGQCDPRNEHPFSFVLDAMGIEVAWDNKGQWSPEDDPTYESAPDARRSETPPIITEHRLQPIWPCARGNILRAQHVQRHFPEPFQYRHPFQPVLGRSRSRQSRSGEVQTVYPCDRKTFHGGLAADHIRQD